jgi:methyl-accepting chemotaxis protein
MPQPIIFSLFTSPRRRAEQDMLGDLTRKLAAVGRANGMVELALDGRCLTANEIFLATLGAQQEDVCGRPYHAVLAEADGAVFRQVMEKLGRGESVTAGLHHLRRDGSAIELNVAFAPVTGAAGEIEKILALSGNLSRQEQDNEAAKQKARQALENISSAVMMVDREFIITYVNKATRELLARNANAFGKVWPGFDPASILGMCIDTFHRNPAHQRRMMADTTKLPFRTDIGIGDLKFALNVGPSYDSRGNYDGNILEWQDVTEIRTQQGQLVAIDKAQAVIEFTLDGRIINANTNFLTTFGYSLEDIRGQHHSMFIEPADRQTPDYRAFWEKLGRGEYDTGQYKRIGRGGQEVWIQAIYSPILDQNRRPFKVVKYATDITEKVAQDIATRQIVDQMVVFLGALAEGDLSRRIDGEHRGMFAQIKDNANASSTRLADIVSRIVDASNTIATASSEISSGSADLAARTEEQASSLEETAASMEQLAATVRQNSENAQQANELAAGTRSAAERGGTVAGDAVAAMGQIESSSQKIADIIGVIDEIAFQTNLLALNAAVEAARAGDAGKGFAVVATEVRALAQRSAQSSKEIKALISASGHQVREGVKLVRDAGDVLGEIVNSVKRVADIVADIAAASREQSTGLEQINIAVSKMDEMTQQNAALVEESAAAARSMDEQSSQLSEMMRFFTTDGTEPRRDQSPPALPHGDPGAQARQVRSVVPLRREAPRQAKLSKLPRKAVNGHKPASNTTEDWAQF